MYLHLDICSSFQFVHQRYRACSLEQFRANLDGDTQLWSQAAVCVSAYKISRSLRPSGGARKTREAGFLVY